MTPLRMTVPALAAVLIVLDAPAPIVVLCLVAAGLLFMRAQNNERVQMACICLLMTVSTSIHASTHHSAFQGTETEWVISFTDDIRLGGDRLQAGVVETSTGEPFQLRYRMQTEKEKHALEKELAVGMTCRIKAEASPPAPSRNPGEFNYRQYLATSGTFFVLTADQLKLSQCVRSTSIRHLPGKWRMAAIDQIEAVFPEPLSSTAAALLFGDRTGESEEVNEDYERLGIVHILSISGLHVTLLTGLLFFVMIRLGVTRERSRVVLLAALPLYCLLAGASPPVIRACLMTGAILFAASRHQQLKASSALSIAFIAMILYNPFSLFQAGFQLSFIVTFALVLSSGIILKRAQSALVLSWFVTILSQIAALPVLLYHFSELSLISPLANLLFVPFYSLLMLPLLLLLFLFSFVVPVSLPAGLANALLNKMNQLAAFLSDLPVAVLVTGQPGMAVLAVVAFIAAGCFVLWENTGRLKYSLAVCGFLLIGLVFLNKYTPYGEVTFLDVGQGDSIFIKLPFNQGTYLIDTGGQVPFEKEAWMAREHSFSVGKDTIVPFLKRKGVTEIDKLILTHADFDHAGAAAEVLESIPAKEIIISPGSGNVEVMAGILETGLPVREGIGGEQWAAGDAFFQFLLPKDRTYEGNNDSLVLYAEMGGQSWLFTGDLEEAGELELIQTYRLQADWLKVGHHGSKTSSSKAFIDGISPEFGVISAGVKNRYGHPHKEVVDTLEEAGVFIYRTDEHGAVTYTFKGKEGRISTVIPEK